MTCGGVSGNFVYITIPGVNKQLILCEVEVAICDNSESQCDATCGCGYTVSTKNLYGTGQTSSFPGQGIANCKAVCDSRQGCTSFKYNAGGNENYKCFTYTGSTSNIRTELPNNDWQSCVKDTSGVITCYMLTFRSPLSSLISQSKTSLLSVLIMFKWKQSWG